LKIVENLNLPENAVHFTNIMVTCLPSQNRSYNVLYFQYLIMMDLCSWNTSNFRALCHQFTGCGYSGVRNMHAGGDPCQRCPPDGPHLPWGVHPCLHPWCSSEEAASEGGAWWTDCLLCSEEGKVFRWKICINLNPGHTL